MKKIFVLTIVVLAGLLAGSRSMAQEMKNGVPVRTTDPSPRAAKVQVTVPLKGGGGGPVAGATTAVTGAPAGKGVPAVGGVAAVGGVPAVGGASAVPGATRATGSPTGAAQVAPVKQGSGGTTRTATAVTGGNGAKSTITGAAGSKAPIKSAASAGAAGSNPNTQ